MYTFPGRSRKLKHHRVPTPRSLFSGKKTPGGAGTHTGHTGHADAQRHDLTNSGRAQGARARAASIRMSRTVPVVGRRRRWRRRGRAWIAIAVPLRLPERGGFGRSGISCDPPTAHAQCPSHLSDAFLCHPRCHHRLARRLLQSCSGRIRS